MSFRTWQAAFLGMAMVAGGGSAFADKIRNPTAVFSGLDKITGRIISFEVAVGETVQFGALQMTPRVCYTRPATEEPSTTAFLEVDEITLDSKRVRIFTGWMYAASPGLHGIEHPIYDIWLTDCKGGTEIIREAKPEVQNQGTGAAPPPPVARQPRTPPATPPRQPGPQQTIPNEAPFDIPPDDSNEPLE